jgi:hypothetical protein
MTRMVAPDKGVKETTIGNRAYRPDRGGIYHVSNPQHVAAMKREGYFEASLNPVSAADRNRGYKCVECGFDGWFRKCGRCGHENTKAE